MHQLAQLNRIEPVNGINSRIVIVSAEKCQFTYLPHTPIHPALLYDGVRLLFFQNLDRMLLRLYNCHCVVCTLLQAIRESHLFSVVKTILVQ